MNKKRNRNEKDKNYRVISLPAGIVCTLTLLTLLPMSAFALGPGCQFGNNYITDMGPQIYDQRFTPDTIILNKDVQINDVIYEVPLSALTFTCYSDTIKFGPYITRGNGFITRFNPELKKAGLKLQLEINGTTWSPEDVESIPIGSNYENPGPSDARTINGKLQLIVRENMSKPVKISVPKVSDILDIIYGPGRKTANYIALGTSNSTWVNYIPKCIGKVRMPTDIDLGRVITGGRGSIPSPRQFKITTSFNQECNGFSDVSGWNSFTLPLFIQFEAPGGELTPGGDGVLLKNEQSEKNGLILEIKPGAGGGTPVKFSDWNGINPSLTLTNNPLTTYYTAGLKSAVPISSLKKGNFHQEITVKIRYE
ncbi:hypothetical protein HAY25_004635 [Salmonella enterica]|nr:hypothetical protein [Salmonella enterica]